MTGFSNEWRVDGETKPYLDSCDCQRMRTPDFYGRAVVPQKAGMEFTSEPTAALAAIVNAESYLNARYQTRIRGRCDDEDFVPPSRYMTPLLYRWQQPDYRPWTLVHNARADVLDCRGFDYPVWKPHLVIKPPLGCWGKPEI